MQPKTKTVTINVEKYSFAARRFVPHLSRESVVTIKGRWADDGIAVFDRRTGLQTKGSRSHSFRYSIDPKCLPL
jgi:hypothetical protein